MNNRTIGLEGCSDAYYWQRELVKLGHKVKLLPAQHVKAHVRGNKNDYNDALGIAEASRVPQMREVTPKTIEQQSMQSLHRLRESVIGDRNALSSQLRGLLSEFGIIFPQGITHIRDGLYGVLEDAENELTFTLREALALKHTQFAQLDALIKGLDKLIDEASKAHQDIALLRSAPGYGRILSSAFYSVIGDGKAFSKGRDASAAVGIVPKQHSTGDKTVLLGISKRGAMPKSGV